MENGRKQKLEGKGVTQQTTEELWFRLNLVKSVLKMLRTDPDMKDDPRQPDAIKTYQQQAKTLRDEIKCRDGKPVETKLKTAQLTKRLDIKNQLEA